MSTAPETLNARPTVLLVEDDEMLRRLLSRTLKDDGFRVLEAENGNIALQIAGRLSRSPGIVLTDITMPVMDGFQFARVFRALYPAVPILFMSGAVPQVTEGVPLLDADVRVLLKPFAPDVLLKAIGAALDP